MWFKRALYKQGLRPKPGTIFYSPSLSIIYSFTDGYKMSKERTMKNDSYGDGRVWLVGFLNDFILAWVLMLFIGNLHESFPAVPLLSYWNAFMITFLITAFFSAGQISTQMKLDRAYKKNIGSGNRNINIDQMIAYSKADVDLTKDLFSFDGVNLNKKG
jgi:hypothetical protein